MQLAMMGIDSFAVTVGDDGVCVCVFLREPEALKKVSRGISCNHIFAG